MTTQQDDQVSSSGDATVLPKGIGKILGDAREQQGLSVFDVSSRIKFAPRQIEALEADDFVQLPEAAFVRGFVRSYARLLQLNPEPLIAALPSSHAQASVSHVVKSVDIPMPSALSARRHNIVWLAAALAIALALAIFVRARDHAPVSSESVVKTTIEALELPNVAMDNVSAPVAEKALQAETLPLPAVTTPAALPAKTAKQNAVQRESAQSPVIVTEVKKPVPVKPDPAKPVRTPAKPAQQEAVRAVPLSAVRVESASVADASANVSPSMSFSEHALRLEFDEDAWVEIKDGNDKVLVSKLHRAGSLLRVSGKSPLDVTIGNAKAVRLFDKGKKIHLERYTTADVAHLKLK